MNQIEMGVGEDLDITKAIRRGSGGGTWICGMLSGHRFEALAFPQHAENPEWELNESRISKLWIQRLSDKEVVFNFDRGMDEPAESPLVQAIIEFLCEGLASYIYPD